MVPAATVSVLGLNMKAPLLFVVMVTVVLVAGIGVGVGLGLGVGVGEELPMTVVAELTAVVGVTPGFGLFVISLQLMVTSTVFCDLKVMSLLPQVPSGIIMATFMSCWACRVKVEGETVTLGEALEVQVRSPELEMFLRVTVQSQPLPLK